MALEFKTRTQVVIEAIRGQILSGEIKAGEPLRQAALAEQLQVSRIPIREALLHLEAEGLVRFEPHKGATATEISPDLIDELFELRALLETDLLARSIPLLSEDDLIKAELQLAKLDAALQSENHVLIWPELNSAFHLSLYKALRPQSYEIVSNLNKNSDRYIRMHLQMAGRILKSNKEHQQLLNLCRARDITGACSLLNHHILSAKTEIKQFLLEISRQS
jgi:DNA-binding GntR family transcriptional regulator